MAMKVRYTVVNGEVLGENRGGVKRDYVPDPLGNTVALLDNTQTKTDTWEFWPYGEVRTRTGTTGTPFQFVGTRGYYRDSASRTYIRARTDRQDLARWLTQDPNYDLLDGYNSYSYVRNCPVSWFDFEGRYAQRPTPAPVPPNPAVKPGACPGDLAYAFLLKLLRENSACAKAFKSLCKGSLPEVIKPIPIVVKTDCGFGPNTSSCGHLPHSNPCKPTEICFTTTLCNNAGYKVLGCLLLLEMGNWCTCKNKNRIDEKDTAKLIRACGLSKLCWPRVDRATLG